PWYSWGLEQGGCLDRRTFRTTLDDRALWKLDAAKVGPACPGRDGDAHGCRLPPAPQWNAPTRHKGGRVFPDWCIRKPVPHSEGYGYISCIGHRLTPREQHGHAVGQGRRVHRGGKVLAVEEPELVIRSQGA